MGVAVMERRCGKKSVLASKLLALGGAEAVLLVNNDAGQVAEFYGFLNEGMCADKDGDFAAGYPFQKLGAADVGPSLRINF